MAFSRLAPIAGAVLMCIWGSSANAEEAKTPSPLVPGANHMKASEKGVPKLNFQPLFGNEVVRMSQEGTPVTYLQDLSIQLGREMAKSFLKDEEERRKRGEKVPERVKRDLWAEREKEVAERRAKYGPEHTKNFTIPGTTPEISARIFSPEGRVYKDQAGNTVYETKQEIVTQYTNGEMKIVPRNVVNIVLTNVREDHESAADAPATPETEAYNGSLAGVEKGFDASDMRDAAAILVREGKGVRVDSYFSDVPANCDGCSIESSGASPVSPTNNDGLNQKTEKTTETTEGGELPPPIPVSESTWEKVFTRLLGIESASAAQFDLEEITRQGKALMAEAEKKDSGLEENTHDAWAQAEAVELVEELARAGRLEPKAEEVETLGYMTEQQLAEIAQAEAANPTIRDTYIFVSYSLGDDALLDILESASGKDNVELVMRGIPKDSNLVDGLVRIRNLAARFDPIPNIIIDPMLFRAYDVKVVPTVVRVSDKRMARPKVRLIDEVREKTGMSDEECKANDNTSLVRKNEVPADYRGRTVPMMIAKVEGLNNARWLNERIANGHTGDFGNKGYVYPIHEPDFIEVMQKRALGIDWEKAKQRAIDNFWTEQSSRFWSLPTAKTSVSRVLDPTFIVSQDIRDIKGTFIHRKGDLVNPLDHLPFNDAIVIFNPRRAEEVEVAKLLKRRFEKDKAIGQVVWIASEFDATRGWDSYTEITETLDAPVYLLMPDIVQRWEVKVTPTVITANNNTRKFIVEEIAPCVVDPQTGVCVVE